MFYISDGVTVREWFEMIWAKFLGLLVTVQRKESIMTFPLFLFGVFFVCVYVYVYTFTCVKFVAKPFKEGQQWLR